MLAHDTGPLLSFAKMKEARAFKAELKRLTGSDAAYYAVLERFGIEHFDQVPKGADPEKHAKTILDALRMEVNVCAWESAGPPRPAKLFVPFNHYKELEQVRSDLQDFGEEAFYDKTLKRYGCTSIAELPVKEGKKAYQELCLKLNQAKADNGLLDILEQSSDVIGARLFAEVLKRHDCATVADVMALAGDPLANLLKELKFWVDDHKSKA